MPLTSPEECKARFLTVADLTFDWEFRRNEEHKFIYVSPSCERISGYTAEEFMDDPDLYLRLVHQDDRPAVLELQLETRSLPGDQLEQRIIHKDGTIRRITHVGQPVLSFAWQFRTIRGSNRDITQWMTWHEKPTRPFHL